jgi:hypothetical protein
MSTANPQRNRWLWGLVTIMAVGALLRFQQLGNTFQSSDNVELAVRILDRPGWAWMVYEPYGLLISVWVKLWAILVSISGKGLTEFDWKAAVALAGTLQIPVVWHWMQRWGASKWAAILACLAVAVLPIHIFQSRYLWGYEVLGALFVLPAIGSTIRFLQAPSWGHAVRASLMLTLYLLSHGYFLPFLPLLVGMFAVFGPGRHLAERCWRGGILFMRYCVWLLPVLALPLYLTPLRHALAKKSALGWYVDDHFAGFLGDLGWPLLVLILAAGASLWWQRGRPAANYALLFFMGFLLYLLPLMLASPPGITVVRGYMLMGCFLGIMGLALRLDGWLHSHRRLVIAAMGIACLWTAAGTYNALFNGKGALATGIVVERGSIPKDPCTKAAGWFLQHHDPGMDLHVVALHRAVEPPNYWYYFKRDDSAWYDLSIAATLAKFEQARHWADVFIVDPVQLDSLGELADFSVRSIFTVGGAPQLILLSRPTAHLPAGTFDYLALNARFDHAFAPNLVWPTDNRSAKPATPAPDYEGAIVERRTNIPTLPSASGMAQLRADRWLVVGDDAKELFVVGEDGLVLDRIPTGDWTGLEEAARLPKSIKRDYEAIAGFERGGKRQFIALGSGSKIPERTWITLGTWENGRVTAQEYPAAFLYDQLMRDAEIMPESLNIEGAVVQGDQLLLLNREDNLVLKISLDGFIQSVQSQSLQLKDRFTHSVLALPEFGGVVAGLSGACIGPDQGRIYFSASVEDKSGTVNDGQILGSYIGWFSADADSLIAPTTYHLVDHVGNRTFDKLESIELLSITDEGIRFVGVTDNDDGTSQWLQILLPKAAHDSPIAPKN